MLGSIQPQAQGKPKGKGPGNEVVLGSNYASTMDKSLAEGETSSAKRQGTLVVPLS